jgi:hypothetical protein
MDLHIVRQRLTVPTVSVAVAPAVGLTALSYGNGYSLIAATVVGTATAVVGLWAIITEP